MRPALASSPSPTSTAASHDPAGLDVPSSDATCPSTARSPGRPGRGHHNDELFALDVDVLVLAALEGQITAANAGTRSGADPRRGGQRPGQPRTRTRSFARNGVAVIPDILCNAGGVIVSYFEWAQNRAAVAWTLDEINDRLRRQILAAADAVWARAEADGIDPRLAAQAIAVERVAEATRLRGLYP